MRRSNGYSGQCMFLSSRVCCLNNFVASVPVMVLRNNKKISIKNQFMLLPLCMERNSNLLKLIDFKNLSG